MSTCRHGQTDSHGEPSTKDWCPGGLSPFLEAWRLQLEFQMNAPTFGPVVLGFGDQAMLVHPHLYEDSLKDFRPIGYFIDGRWCMFSKPGELVARVLP